MNIGLIDYGRGNLRSVEKALEKVGASVSHVSDASGFTDKDAIVLPGVGAFGDAMANLESRGLVTPIKEWLDSGKPFLGICLGYQLLFSGSDESPGVEGLGWLPGRVVRFPASVGKVPHMGWNAVTAVQGPLLEGLEGDAYFYHVHSFYPVDVPEEVVACRTDYGLSFASGISKGNVHAIQFHPEKSQDNGLKLLGNFLDTVKCEMLNAQ